MASSTYKSIMIYSRLLKDSIKNISINHRGPYQNIVNLNENTVRASMKYNTPGDLENLLKIARVDLHQDYEGPLTDYIILSTGSNHTCRETLLSELNGYESLMNLYESYTYSTSIRYSHFVNPVVYIEYIGEDYKHYIDHRQKELIMKFYNKFMIDSGADFYVQEWEQIIVLSYKNPNVFKTMVASFILWIFRNQDIMEKCLSNFKDTDEVPFNELLMFLSFEFLKNYGWGNEANPNILLSLFAYGARKIKEYNHLNKNFIDGPARFSTYIYTDTLINYVNEVLFKVFNGKRVQNVHLTNCSIEFQNSINKIYYMVAEKNTLQRAIDELKGNSNGNT